MKHIFKFLIKIVKETAYYLSILGFLILAVIFYGVKLIFYIIWDPVLIYNSIKESKTLYKFIHNLIDL